MDGAAHCDVVVLAAHESGQSILATSGAEGTTPVLPVRRTAIGADDGQVVAEARSVVGPGPVILRICTVAWTAGFDASVVVVETAPLAGDAPAGHEWVAVPAHGRLEVAPTLAQPVVDRWLEERLHGVSAGRAPWARTGWWDEAVGWALTAAQNAGLHAAGPPELEKMWGISVVLRLPLVEGDAYFKQSCASFRAEAAVTAALAAWAPAALPDVIALDADEGRLLMHDLGGVPLDEQQPAWAAGLMGAADLQRSCSGRIGWLLASGAQDRPLTRLAETAAHLERHDELMARLPVATRQRWSAAAARVADCCLLLDELGPAPTLVHGDLHPGNMVIAGRQIKIFDWTDASVSHPFVDLIPFLRGAPAADRGRLLDAYLGRWADELSPTLLERAGRLALPVGAFYQVQTYLQLLPTLLPEDRCQLRDGDVRWLERCLTLLDEDATLTV
jgi:hypothetical protein